jgi:hypothetical protein
LRVVTWGPRAELFSVNVWITPTQHNPFTALFVADFVKSASSYEEHVTRIFSVNFKLFVCMLCAEGRGDRGMEKAA